MLIQGQLPLAMLICGATPPGSFRGTKRQIDEKAVVNTYERTRFIKKTQQKQKNHDETSADAAQDLRTLSTAYLTGRDLSRASTCCSFLSRQFSLASAGVTDSALQVKIARK